MKRHLIGSIKIKEKSEMVYELPALVGPHKGELVTEDRLEPFVELPPVFQVERSIRCYGHLA